nr:hypothetical protein Iba_chr14bCG13470 [Ipomoea batatas]
MVDSISGSDTLLYVRIIYIVFDQCIFVNLFDAASSLKIPVTNNLHIPLMIHFESFCIPGRVDRPLQPQRSSFLPLKWRPVVGSTLSMSPVNDDPSQYLTATLFPSPKPSPKRFQGYKIHSIELVQANAMSMGATSECVVFQSHANTASMGATSECVGRCLHYIKFVS